MKIINPNILGKRKTKNLMNQTYTEEFGRYLLNTLSVTERETDFLMCFVKV